MECGTEEEGGFFDVIRELGPGEHFGEVALVKNTKRSLSVRVRGETQLLTLSKDAFNRILGNIKHLLKCDYKTDPKSVDSTPLSTPRGTICSNVSLFDVKEDQKGEMGSTNISGALNFQ